MLDPVVRDLARAKNYAVFTTLMRDGMPQSGVVWIDADDDHLLVNSELHRTKTKNVERDPRVNVVIIDSGNPYHTAEIRGRVVEVQRGPEARAHIDALSRKYTGDDYANPIQSERVILRIAPEKQNLR